MRCLKMFLGFGASNHCNQTFTGELKLTGKWPAQNVPWLKTKTHHKNRNMQEPVDEADAIASWIVLRDLTCLGETKRDAGEKAIEHFFPQHQFHIFCHGIEQPGRRKAVEDVLSKKRGISDVGKTERLKLEYGIYKRLYGTPVSPAITKWLMAGLSPHTAVLDFAAGSGARCLAAMSLCVPFYGIVQSRREQRKYMEMLATLDHRSDVTVMSPATAELSKHPYDVILSASYELPLTSFLSWAARAWHCLMVGGSMGLLMLPEEYASAKDVLPSVSLESIIEGSKYKIYVWRKPKPKYATRRAASKA